MTTSTTVPETRDELEGDEALDTLRGCGRRRLALDSFDRFRAADGFSQARALAFQMTLALLPAVIAVVGLASALDQDTFRRVVKDTIDALAPGAVGDILTEALKQGNSTSKGSGKLALAGGALAALTAGTTAMAQVQRGANRIYGIERDRPMFRKYFMGLGLALTAGLLGILSATVLVGGAAIRGAVEGGDTFNLIWSILRWPLGFLLAVGSIALLFETVPHRRQPEWTWLAFGAVASAVLWLAFMGLFALYVGVTDSFGATYGPVAGTIGVLLWSFLTATALFLGLAFAAQLEAVRAGVTETRVEEREPSPR